MWRGSGKTKRQEQAWGPPKTGRFIRESGKCRRNLPTLGAVLTDVLGTWNGTFVIRHSQLDDLPAFEVHVCERTAQRALHFSTIQPLLGTSPVINKAFWP